MLKDLTSYYFWFTQPSTILAPWDRYFLYISGGMIGVAVIFWLLSKFASKHGVHKKLLLKFWHLFLPIGISGLIWFGLRYENTPIFSQRYWFGLNLVIGIIWLLFILKYVLFNFTQEKQAFDRELLKAKYMPGSNRNRV